MKTNEFIHWIYHTISNIHAMLSGLAIGIIGYFLPIHNIVRLLIILFIADVVFGYWAAKKLRSERFSVKIVWEHTIPRMLVSIVLILGAYMWDNVYEQNLVSTYKIIGWFISGVLLYSIAENGYNVTKWSVFPKISTFFSDKMLEANLGLKITDEEEEELKTEEDETSSN